MTDPKIVRILQATIAGWKSAIAKHGPVKGYVESLAVEERILASYLKGETDADGQWL